MKKINLKIAVLLSTYNGAKYIRKQIDSVLQQTYNEIEIYISDDFSSDETLEIIQEYVFKYPNIFHILNNKSKLGGACKNFLSLVERVDADIYFFCDQDDYWHHDKIEKTLTCYERLNDAKNPTLIHSDLRIVDSELNVINSSFMDFTKKSSHLTWKDYLVENNNVVGCTAAINKVLAELYKKNCSKINKDKIFMHDSFFAQLASLSGKIEYIDEALIDYRQHGNNTVGAKEKGHLLHLIKNKFTNLKEGELLFIKKEENVSEVLKCLTFECNEKISVATDFSQLYDKGKLSKINFLLKNKIHRKSFFENIYLWFCI